MTRDNSQEPEIEEPALVSAPMRSLYGATKLRNLRSNLQTEPSYATNSLEEGFISRGEMHIDEAQKLFAFFKKAMNHFLWGEFAVHDSLTSVRRPSSLLSACNHHGCISTCTRKPGYLQYLLQRIYYTGTEIDTESLSYSGRDTSLVNWCILAFASQLATFRPCCQGGYGDKSSPESSKVAPTETRAIRRSPNMVFAICL